MHRYGNIRPLCRDVSVGIIRNGGLSSLYAGWIAVLCRNIPHSMIKVSRCFQHSIHVLIEVAETSRFFCHRTSSVCRIVCHAKDLIFSILINKFHNNRIAPRVNPKSLSFYFSFGRTDRTHPRVSTEMYAFCR